MQRHPETLDRRAFPEARSSARWDEAARDYLWFAAMLMVLLAGVAVHSAPPDTASAIVTAAP